MKYAMIMFGLLLILSCGGGERPMVALENLQITLVDDGGIQIRDARSTTDSIYIRAVLTEEAQSAWRNVEKKLGHSPILTWVTVSAKLSKDGEELGRHQFRLHQLKGLNPSNPEILVTMPRQASRTHDQYRPPPPEGTDVECNVWAVQLD